MFGDRRDEGIPGAGVRVYEVVVSSPCYYRRRCGLDVREEKIDYDFCGDVDGDPSYGVLAGEGNRDFA